MTIFVEIIDVRVIAKQYFSINHFCLTNVFIKRPISLTLSSTSAVGVGVSKCMRRTKSNKNGFLKLHPFFEAFAADLELDPEAIASGRPLPTLPGDEAEKKSESE